MAIHSSIGELPLNRMSVSNYWTRSQGVTYAWVTHATSGAKPAMWSFSFSSTFLEINIGKAQFFTPIFLILALNQVWISSQMNHEAGY